MDARPGDRITITPNSLGVAPRSGQVFECSGSFLHVRWDDGHETVFMPGSDCRVESGDRDEEDAPLVLGAHIDLRVTEDDERCEAVATLVTGRGTFQGHGVARRHPTDAPVPLIGEELAIGRALESLASQLLGEADDAISRHVEEPVHLLT